MTEIRKAYSQDFGKVYPLLREHFQNPTSTEGDFHKLFEKHWRTPEDHCGYILTENGRPVGYLGTIFSYRPIFGRMERFCNLAAWYVQPEYRSSSIQLILSVLAIKDTTFTNLSASSRVIQVLRKLNFKSLEEKIWFIPPIGVPTRIIQMQVEAEPNKFECFLSSEQRMILKDHIGLKCLHAFIQTHNGSCYCVATKAIKKGLPVINLDYISNAPLFTENAIQISFALCRKWHAFSLMVGDHFFTERKPTISLPVTRKHPLLFRSNRVAAFEMDTLYSEIQLLGITPV